MRYFCDDRERHENAPAEAEFIGLDGDALFLMCAPCCGEWAEENPASAYFEVAPERKSLFEVRPGDVVSLPIAESGGMSVLDLDTNLEMVKRLEMTNDRRVLVEFVQPLAYTRGRDEKVTVLAHDEGFGSDY